MVLLVSVVEHAVHSQMSQAWYFFKHCISLPLNFLIRNSAAEDTVTSLRLKLLC